MGEQGYDLDSIALELKDVNLIDIQDALVKKGVLSDRSIEEHLKLLNGNVEWYKPFLLEIIEQGLSVLRRFLKILNDSGYQTVSDRLQENLKVSLVDDGNTTPSKLNAFGRMMLNDDNAESSTVFVNDAESDGVASSCCAVQEDDENDREAPFPFRSFSSTVVVKNGEVFHSPNEDRIYMMGSKPKGYACVIVNQDFSGDLYKHRKGAGKDQLNLIQLFNGLGYVVHDFFNKSSQEMRQILRKFSELPEHSSVDSCIVAISSHGETNRLVGTDNEYVFMEDILDMFNNEKCPRLKGKPKLFFIQACRGDKFDAGISNNNTADGRSVSVTNKLLQPQQRSSSWTDMVIAYSTIPEYVSLHNERHGSWFIIAVTGIFKDHAWNTPLSKMFPMVAELMEYFQTSSGDKQIPEINHRGWKKDLYFNPGLYFDP